MPRHTGCVLSLVWMPRGSRVGPAVGAAWAQGPMLLACCGLGRVVRTRDSAEVEERRGRFARWEGKIRVSPVYNQPGQVQCVPQAPTAGGTLVGICRPWRSGRERLTGFAAVHAEGLGEPAHHRGLAERTAPRAEGRRCPRLWAHSCHHCLWARGQPVTVGSPQIHADTLRISAGNWPPGREAHLESNSR